VNLQLSFESVTKSGKSRMLSDILLTNISESGLASECIILTVCNNLEAISIILVANYEQLSYSTF
jgi:hypothetical protein